MQTNQPPGTLKLGEPHPVAYAAQAFLFHLPAENMALHQESFCSCAISGNRLAEILAETTRRLLSAEPVSDRYMLGLGFSVLQSELRAAAQSLYDNCATIGADDDRMGCSDAVVNRLLELAGLEQRL